MFTVTKRFTHLVSFHPQPRCFASRGGAVKSLFLFLAVFLLSAVPFTPSAPASPLARQIAEISRMFSTL